jgi:hypothetical protein
MEELARATGAALCVRRPAYRVPEEALRELATQFRQATTESRSHLVWNERAA